jgi:GNAT superfamily N-acetyltransferase
LDIEYTVNQSITTDQFINLLNASTLGLRRPVDDRACVEGMLKHGNLLVTAWHEEKLVGVARSVTDFYFACYLSDLAVDEDYQKMGIGKQLQVLTQAQLGPKCSLILLAAPAANDYYSHVGFSHHPRCWVLDRQDSITV